jgi:archaemetzincin
MAEPGNILLTWIGEGPVDEGVLERVRQRVEAAFDLSTQVAVVNGPPGDTLDVKRGQHLSTRILRWILTDLPTGAQKILGITDVDLFIPVLTFVFGEAQVGGPAAVVSTARLRRTFDDKPAPPSQVEARLTKECLHELGHTFGLVHCAERACVMSRCNSVLDVDQKRAAFCRDCRQRLEELIQERDRS